MNPIKVVVVDLRVDFLDECPGSIKPVDVSKFILEMTKEGFFVAVLPRGCLGRNGNLHAMELEVVRDHPGHKFFSLIGVKIGRGVVSNEDRLFNG